MSYHLTIIFYLIRGYLYTYKAFIIFFILKTIIKSCIFHIIHLFFKAPKTVVEFFNLPEN